MKRNWAQPSLSRDFTLLSAAILFVLFLISAWVTYSIYTRHTEKIADELEKESHRIEHTLAYEMENANYLLTAMGRQVVLDPERNMVRLAQTLKSYDSKGYIYSIFSWINPDQQLVVSSNRGVLDKPVDTSDRDYVKKSMAEPWKMHIGRPIEGRVSERWVIPVAMGITDYTGKFIGTIMISIDINTLTERLSNLVKRDGISFAIVSKTLIPLTEVSDDKDFVTNNFPTQKLVNVNLTTSPSGLIAQGNLLWGTGTYSYYRVSSDYPYIILLGYDSHYSDEAMHSMLWSRLLQMFMMALFLVLFLWLMRVRMIKPVLDMTHIAAAVAKGEHYTPLPAGGPVEIEGLSSQIGRIGEYIQETKRIESELRNKMFMLKKAKERAEVDKRSKAEFLAYACQEMRHPLTNIIGFAQVMRDQLYGPIENRKYRQYAGDIYQTGNVLLTNLQELLTLSKVETSYIDLHEKSLDVSDSIQKAIRFVSDKMQSEKLNVKVKLQEPLPKLIADEFRLQQIIMNLLFYAFEHMLPGHTVSVEARVVSEHRERAYYVILITTHEDKTFTPAELLARADQLSYASGNLPMDQEQREQTSINLEIAKLLIAMHHAWFDITTSEDHGITMSIFFGANRIRFSDTPN